MSLSPRLAPLLVLAALACGSDSATGPELQDDLVFRRANAEVITFSPTVYVWCGPWEAGLVPAQTVHVRYGNASARWDLRAVVADIQVGQPMAFPNTFIWDDPQGADVFVYDPPNELSTQEGESSGSITFRELDCGTNGRLRFDIDATIGSEFGDLPEITVEGSFSAAMTGPPGQ